MLTDTHCHLDLDKFDEDRSQVLQRALAAEVRHILIPALDFESSLSVIKLAEAYPDLYAAVGFHPTELEKWNDSALDNLRNSVTSRSQGKSAAKIVAIGEIGLDYYWIKEPEKRSQQRDVLQQQLKLAQELNKPVIIHMREENDAWSGQASLDLLEILVTWHNELLLQNHPLAEKPGVLHSYNGNLETAQKAIDHNFYIGVTGPVTYKNAEQKRSIIKQLPITK